MSDNVFFTIIWSGLGIVLLTLILVLTAYYDNQNRRVADLLRMGADASEIHCAMHETSAWCLVKGNHVHQDEIPYSPQQ